MAQTNKKRRRRSSKKRSGSGPRPARPTGTGNVAGPSASGPVAGGGIPSLKAHRSEAPKPIWAPLPITEVLILVGLIVAVIGLFGSNVPMTIGGLVILGSASIELAAREHFAGYRSHSAMLAGLIAVVTVTVAAFGGSLVDIAIPPWLLGIVGIGLFAWLFVLLRRAFRRRTGGLSFRV